MCVSSVVIILLLITSCKKNLAVGQNTYPSLDSQPQSELIQFKNSAESQNGNAQNQVQISANSFAGIPSVAVNNQFGSNSLAYPNSGYGNYNENREESREESGESGEVDPATPEEIESSYKQSLIHLKSQSGQIPPTPTSQTDFVRNVPRTSFYDVLQHHNFKSFDNSPSSFVTPHLPQMYINPELSPFPEVYSTIPPKQNVTASNFSLVQTFDSGKGTSEIFKGHVQNVPISVQQQALEDRKPALPQPQGFSVDVHYPPKYQGDDSVGVGSGRVITDGPYPSFGAYLKTNFHPSEPDQSNYHHQLGETLFNPPTMSSGFRPSFGPPLKSPKSLQTGGIQQFSHVVEQPGFAKEAFVDHYHHLHAYNPYQNQHQEFAQTFGGHELTPQVVHGPTNPSAEYKFIFMKSPTVEDPDEKTMAYLSYLAQSAATATAHATATAEHSHAHSFPLSSVPSSTHPPILYQLKDSSESPSNSFDKLFPKKQKYRRQRVKQRRQRRRKIRKNSKKYSIALNPSFKGKILPHHWDQLSTTPETGQGGLILAAYNPKFASFPSQSGSPSGSLLSMDEVFRRAYGIDPNIFGGELGTETGKYTRSATSTKGDDDGTYEDSSEEIEKKRKTKKRSGKSSRSKAGKSGVKTKSTTSTTIIPIPTTTLATTTTTPRPITSTSPSITTSTTLATPASITTTSEATVETTTTTTTAPSTTTAPTTIITTDPPTISFTTTTSTIKPSTNTTTSNTTSQTSVHFTISVLPKRYDHEATSESRKAQVPLPAEKSQNSSAESSEYSSSEEYYEDSSASDEAAPSKTTKHKQTTFLQTNGHQKVPLSIADDDNDHVLIPLYFESSKMPDDFSTTEYDDMMMDSGHKKKDLSSETKTDKNSKESGKKSRKKIKPSVARQLIKQKGKKRVQKVKKPKNSQSNPKHESPHKNLI